MFSFMVTLLFKVEILTVRVEYLRKILTGHELNQDMVRMQCNCGIEMGTR